MDPGSSKKSPYEASSPSPSGHSSAAGGRPQSSHGSTPPRIRRRNRLITSCLECRRRKLKCDKSHPCTNCTRFSRDCVFLAPALDSEAQMKLAEIKEKMGSLERTLEEDVARRAAGLTSDPGKGKGRAVMSSDDESDDDDEVKELEPTTLAFPDATYFEDAEDDLMDLGVQVGKMRITDRIGGFVRPKLAQELAWVMKERMKFPFPAGDDLTAAAAASITDAAGVVAQAVLPGADYIAPASSLFFGPEPTSKASFMQYVPSRLIADRLLQQYWDAVHPMCKCVHRPSFDRQYILFWNTITAGAEPAYSLQAAVFAAMLSAVISMPDEAVAMELGVNKTQLHQNFQAGTEIALHRANFLRSSKLQTLQAFVMYLIPMCRGEVSRAHSALAGTAIRLAECMGLHRDGSHYNLTPVEVHVRRLLWHQLCFLDLRTCEATGPRLQIHRDDFDTKFPLNVDDADLETSSPPTDDVNRWTDSTFIITRFLANEMLRNLWFERSRLEKKKTTLTAILAKVQSWINSVEQKYFPIMDKSKPLHLMAYMTFKLTSLRSWVMILHRYVSNHIRVMPDKLRKILLSSAVSHVECAIALEVNPALSVWSWYRGAFHQYHTTLLLLTELYAAPERYHEDRIWRCLDFVFELPANQDRRRKAQHILTEVMQKSYAYNTIRKIRAPKSVEEQPCLAAIRAKPEPSPQSAQLSASLSPPQRPPQPRSASIQQQSGLDTLLQAGLLQQAGMADYRQRSPQGQEAYYNYGALYGAPSPHGSDRSVQGGVLLNPGESAFRLGPMPPDAIQDVDWNELDRLFPPDTQYSSMIQMPEFTFEGEFTTYVGPRFDPRNLPRSQS